MRTLCPASARKLQTTADRIAAAIAWLAALARAHR